MLLRVHAVNKACVRPVSELCQAQAPLAKKCENTLRKSKLWLGIVFFLTLLFSTSILQQRAQSDRGRCVGFSVSTALLYCIVHSYMATSFHFTLDK